MTAKIVVVGSFNADLVSYMERMPRPGETVHGDRFATGAGGKGSNQAVAAARLGADVTFIGRVGNDVFANLAYEIWDAEGVNREFVKRDKDVATGVAPILVDSSGENMIVVVLGANRRLRESDIDAARERIAAADMLVVQLEVNLDMVPYALKAAKEFGVATILNPAPAAPISRETIQLADYLTPNEIELETLNGGEFDDVVSAATRFADPRRSDSGGHLGRRMARGSSGPKKRIWRRHSRSMRSIPLAPATPSTRRWLSAVGRYGSEQMRPSLRQCGGGALRHQARRGRQRPLPR